MCALFWSIYLKSECQHNHRLYLENRQSQEYLMTIGFDGRKKNLKTIESFSVSWETGKDWFFQNWSFSISLLRNSGFECYLKLDFFSSRVWLDEHVDDDVERPRREDGELFFLLHDTRENRAKFLGQHSWIPGHKGLGCNCQYIHENWWIPCTYLDSLLQFFLVSFRFLKCLLSVFGMDLFDWTIIFAKMLSTNAKGH